MLQEAHAARLHFPLQVGDAGGERLEGRPAVRLLAQLLHRPVALALRLGCLLARFVELLFGLLSALLGEGEVGTHRPRAEEPARRGTERKTHQKDDRNCYFHSPPS